MVAVARTMVGSTVRMLRLEEDLKRRIDRCERLIGAISRLCWLLVVLLVTASLSLPGACYYSMLILLLCAYCVDVCVIGVQHMSVRRLEDVNRRRQEMERVLKPLQWERVCRR